VLLPAPDRPVNQRTLGVDAFSSNRDEVQIFSFIIFIINKIIISNKLVKNEIKTSFVKKKIVIIIGRIERVPQERLSWMDLDIILLDISMVFKQVETKTNRICSLVEHTHYISYTSTVKYYFYLPTEP